MTALQITIPRDDATPALAALAKRELPQPVEPRSVQRVCGVYGIQHTATKRWYVGSGWRIGERYSAHVAAAAKGDRACIHRVIREYGTAAFTLTLLEECDRPALRQREKHWIEQLNSCSVHGFNTIKDPTKIHDPAGKKQNAVTIERRAIALRGLKRSQDARDNIRRGRIEAVTKYPVTDETRAKLSAMSKGKKRKPESTARALATKLLRYGPTLTSPETSAKIAARNKGHIVTEETKLKISAAHKGRKYPPRTPEQIAKYAAAAAARVGVKLSPAHRMALRGPRGPMCLSPEERERKRLRSIGNKSRTGMKNTPESNAKRSASHRVNRLYHAADYVQFMWQLPYRLLLQNPVGQLKQMELL